MDLVRWTAEHVKQMHESAVSFIHYMSSMSGHGNLSLQRHRFRIVTAHVRVGRRKHVHNVQGL